VDQGGLGLFPLASFIQALQCSWIKRCSKSINDNWRYRIAVLGNGNPLNVVDDEYTVSRVGSVLKEIIKSFVTLKGKFTMKDNNYRVVPLYCNPAFGIGRGLREKLDDTFFDIRGNPALRNTLLTLTWGDISANERLFTREVLAVRFNVVLTVQKYGLLYNAFNIAKRKYGKVDKPSMNVKELFSGIKKGSRKYRMIINHSLRPVTINNNAQIQSFVLQLGLEMPSDSRLRSMLSSWNQSYLNSNIRTFLFKFYNNMLGLNSRISHFNPEVNASCTFCCITRTLPAPKETMPHLFFHCTTTQSLLSRFVAKYITNLEVNESNFFFANNTEFEYINRPLGFIFDIFRYTVWHFKLKKEAPNFIFFENEFNYFLTVTLGSSKKYDTLITNCRYFQIAPNRYGGPGNGGGLLRP
jgi:hypothetical protein